MERMRIPSVKNVAIISVRRLMPLTPNLLSGTIPTAFNSSQHLNDRVKAIQRNERIMKVFHSEDLSFEIFRTVVTVALKKLSLSHLDQSVTVNGVDMTWDPLLQSFRLATTTAEFTSVSPVTAVSLPSSIFDQWLTADEVVEQLRRTNSLNLVAAVPGGVKFVLNFQKQLLEIRLTDRRRHIEVRLRDWMQEGCVINNHSREPGADETSSVSTSTRATRRICLYNRFGQCPQGADCSYNHAV
jgi:hypothetical protein